MVCDALALLNVCHKREGGADPRGGGGGGENRGRGPGCQQHSMFQLEPRWNTEAPDGLPQLWGPNYSQPIKARKHSTHDWHHSL